MNDLFRREASESFKDMFSTDRQIKKLSVSVRVLAAVFITGILLTGVWFVFGNIASTVNITGVVYPAGGIRYITAPEDGIISDICVTAGEKIEVGDIAAMIPNEGILNKIDAASVSGEPAEELKQDYRNTSVIVSEYSGTVLSVADKGAYIQKGGIIASVAAVREDNDQRQIFALMPSELINSISKGCSVQVSPNYAPREKFGYINGYVNDIGDTAITKSDALKDYDIYSIPSLLDEDKTYVAVYINLLSDPDTASGLNWSDSKSGDIDVSLGTVCENSVVISNQPPYRWLLGGGSR